jgi:hypothetical protein
MDSWCKNWRFKFKNGMLYSEGNEPFTDDGHQLMMFISRKEVFVGGNGVGLCDEKFLGWGYDDSDWGIRALMLGKKNLKSQNSLIGHLQDFTCSQPKYKIMPCDNRKVFIDKYGQDTFNEMQTGQLWLRLHREFK